MLRSNAYILQISQKCKTNQTVQSSFLWDQTGLQSQSTRPYSPVFLLVSILSPRPDCFFLDLTVFFGPDCSLEVPDHTVWSFFTVSKKGHGPGLDQIVASLLFTMFLVA